MKYYLIIATFLVSLNSFAQDGDRREKIKALKVAFITERLDLTPEEAEKFWPVYNTFEEANNKFRREEYDTRKETDFENLSEADANKLLQEWMANEIKKHELRQQFANDLMKILPAKKIIKLRIAEKAFNRQMLEQFKKRRGERKRP